MPQRAKALAYKVMEHSMPTPQTTERQLALSAVFVLARLAYIYCYIMDKASLRSVVWGVAMACSVALYGSALAL